ncbi:hypothetical protein CPter291_2631 [Collimonas pratensis]|uniref:Uncharacterized protein n=2 Tax=Collimonas pratensis TaxID=279113 RepID=A0ABM5Z763_9BURK|nr:hypothetical protein CPter291_2631 [Collimonas pratensis]
MDENGDYEFSEESITVALNTVLNTKFTNVFNRDDLRRDIEKIGMDQLNIELGAPQGKPIITSLNDQDLIRERVHGFIGEQVKIALAGGASTLIDDAGRQRIIAAALDFEARYDKLKPQPKPPLLMTKKAIDDRARQARYRARHKRVWVAK